MPTYDRGFQLGLLPEKKWNWRTFATSYGLLTALILLLMLIGVMTSDTLLPSMNYQVTELVPRPALRPEQLPKPKPLPVHAKLLPPEPVFEAPKLVVPHEVHAPKPQPQEVEPPKVAMNNFAPAVLTQTSGARPVLIHTGDFAGSSVTPTVNAPISKVQTGGFGDPNGLKPSDNSKPNGKLIASAAGSFDMPVGPGQGNGSGGAKGIKGTVASADFGNGVATAGQGDGRRSGRGSVQTSGFGSQEVAQNTPHIQRVDSVPPTPSRNHLQAESGLHGGSEKSETGRRSSAGSGVRGERTAARKSRGQGAWAMDSMKPRSPRPTRCVSSRPSATGRRWIRQQLCTWYFNWRIETLEMRVMRKFMNKLVSSNELDGFGSAGCEP